jgi:3-phenylpropionate/trans-cinnamate dioxygenase ferredoxin reductase subunit
LDGVVRNVVIIGAGHAGGSAVAMLKQYGFEGQIVVVGTEPVAPYQRPPLSKAYLKREIGLESLKLKPDRFYEQDGISLRLSETATAIDRAARTVTLAGGDTIGYDALIIATGSRARKLPAPGADLPGVLELRSIADADALQATLERAKRLAIIGGGYIGLEAAASARLAGVEVVIIEREARVLARVASATISNFFESYHTARGAELLVNQQVAAIEGDAGTGVTGVRLSDGRVLPCEAALVGVGAIACDELARAAGIACEAGIVVDSQARTSDPAIFAIGDVTWRPVPLYNRMFRVESVGNAVEQAKQAVCTILGRDLPPHEVPWFWSDQYDIKLQLAGLAVDVEDIVVRGSPDLAKFAVFHMAGDRVLAVEAVNSASEFIFGKKFIGDRRPVTRDRLTDTTIPMAKVAL